jgi:PAS domain S-box-containing protein
MQLPGLVPNYKTQRRRAALIAAGLVVIIALVSLLAFANYRAEMIQKARLELLSVAGDQSSVLRLALARRVNILQNLQLWVLSTGPDEAIIAADFEDNAAELASYSTGVKGISVAPDGVQRWVYPLAGNEAIVGLNLLDDQDRPDQAQYIRDVMETGGTILSNPYLRPDDSLVLTARRAIFLDNDFWGLTTLVIDLPVVLDEVLLPLDDLGVDVALRADDGVMFYGPDIFGADPVLTTVTILNTEWEIGILPEAGWTAYVLPSLTGFAISGVLLCVLVGVIGYVLVGQNLRLREHNRLLAVSQSRYQGLVAASYDAVVGVDSQNTIMIFNQAAEAMFGRSAAEMLGESVARLMPEAVNSLGDMTPSQYLRVVRRRGNPQSTIIETMGLKADGRTFPIELSLSLGDYSEGHLAILVIRDISTRKAAEATTAQYIARIQDEIEQRKKSQQAERDQRRLAEALRDNATAISSTLDLSQVLDLILTHLEEVMPPFKASRIMLIDDGQARIVHSQGYSPDALAAFRDLGVLPDALANLKWIVDTQQALAIADVREYPDWILLESMEWIRAYLGAPICLEDRVIGIISLASEQPGIFTAEHARILMAFASQAGIAIRNARLFEAERKQQEVSNTLYSINLLLNSSLSLHDTFELLMVGAQRLVNCDASSLILVEGELCRIAHSIGFELFTEVGDIAEVFGIREVPSIQQVIETRQAFSIPDVAQYDDWIHTPTTAWIRSWAGVPILARDQRVIGVLTVDSEAVGAFDAEKVDLLAAFTNAAALAIENSRLFEAEQRQRRVAETLQDTALTLTSALDQDLILKRIMAQTGQVLPYDTAGIWLKKDDGLFQLAAGVGYDRFQQVGAIDVLRLDTAADSFLQRIQDAEHHTIILHDVQEEAHCPFCEGMTWVRALAAGAIMLQEELVGVFVLQHSDAGVYAAADQKTLDVLTTQLSVAIENAHFFQETQRYLGDMIALREVVLELAASQQSLKAIIALTLRRLSDLVPSDRAGIWLWDTAEQALYLAGDDEVQHRAANYRDVRLGMGEGFVGQALQQRETMVLDDYRAWNGAVSVFEERGDVFYATLAAPMYWRDEPLGVIYAALDTPDRGYTDDDRHMMEFFAAHVAPSIVNAKLHEEVQGYVFRLQDLVQARTNELEYESSRLQAILDSMGEGVIYIESGEVNYVNGALTAIAGYELRDLQGVKDIWAALIDEGDDADPAVRLYADRVNRVLALGGVWRDRVRIRRRDGDVLDASLTATLVALESRSVVILVRDISQERQLEAQKDRFITHASHELRTPLTNMKTRLYLMRRQRDRLDEHLGVMDYVVNRMQELVNGLLSLSRFERGVITLDRQDVILQTLIENVIRVQQPEAEQQGLSLTTDMPGVPVHGSIDPNRIEQVITNLVANAMNYTEEGGRITIRLAVLPDDRQARVMVEDTGIGIEAEKLEQIFEPFFRVREGEVAGAGLGLAISREIVTLHGGTITVDSTPREGSTFSFTVGLMPDRGF